MPDNVIHLSFLGRRRPVLGIKGYSIGLELQLNHVLEPTVYPKASADVPSANQLCGSGEDSSLVGVIHALVVAAGVNA